MPPQRFRCEHCQVETLCFCSPPSVRRVLDELPETLDGTYERTLFWINKQTRKYAHCIFQYLVISIGQLRVKKLAEPSLFCFHPWGNDSGVQCLLAPRFGGSRRIFTSHLFHVACYCRRQRQKTVLTFL